MAEEKDDAQPAEEKETKPKRSSKSLFIIIGIIVFALAGGVAAYMLLAGKGGSHETKKEEKEKEKKEVKTALVALDSFVLNLSEHGRFLKVSMQLELTDIANVPLVNEKTPQIRDAIITLMSSKSVESVSSAEGKLQLKDELLLRVNQAVGKEIVKNLFFTEFVMQ